MRKFFAALLGFVSIFGSSAQSESPAPKIEDPFVMVVLDEPSIPTAKAITDYIKVHWPNALPLQEALEGNGSIVFGPPDNTPNRASAELVMIALMDFPIPASDTEYACRAANYWPNACADLQKSKAHLIVSVSGGSGTVIDRNHRAMMLTQACLDLTKSIGVFWVHSDSVWQKQYFTELGGTTEGENPSLLIWLGMKTEREEDGTISAITSGLPAFGLKNIEIQRSQKPVIEIHEFIAEVANWLMKTPQIIPEGDTVGFTEDQRIKVSYGPSLTGSGETVMKLGF